MTVRIPYGDTRDGMEAGSSADIPLGFMTLTHPALHTPLRIVSDALDYVVDGETYIGMPFGVTTITDTEAAPSTQLRVQNVDRRIGQAILAMKGRVQCRLDVRMASAFDLTEIPRVALGSAPVIYGFRYFDLVDATVNAIEATGRVMLREFAQEPWPGQRATQELCPALFR